MAFSTEGYVVQRAGGPIQLDTIHYNSLCEFEILVDTVAVSLCQADLKAAKGDFLLKPPMILGHEAAGYVKAVGTGVRSVKAGDAVILSYASCMRCPQCLTGRNAYCDNLQQLNYSGRRIDGTVAATDKSGQPLHSHFFGQSSLCHLALAHEMNAVRVDATREELQKFAALGCGIQTGAGAILNVLKPPAGSYIVVFGAGSVGFAACLAAALTSPTMLVLVDHAAEKLSLNPTAAVTHTINSTLLAEGELTSELRKLTNGRGFDYAIDAVGSGSLIKDGHGALATGGTVLTLGGSLQTPAFTLQQHLIKGITYRGCHQGDAVPRIFIPFMIDLWRQDKFPFDKLLTMFPFTDLQRALDETKRGKVVKAVLVL